MYTPSWQEVAINEFKTSFRERIEEANPPHKKGIDPYRNFNFYNDRLIIRVRIAMQDLGKKYAEFSSREAALKSYEKQKAGFEFLNQEVKLLGLDILGKGKKSEELDLDELKNDT